MSTSAGWYADPAARHQYRWFDGNDWTDQIADSGAVEIDPVRGGPVEPAATDQGAEVARTQAAAPVSPQLGSSTPGGVPEGQVPAQQGGGWGRRKVLLVVGAVVVFVALAIGLAMVLGGGDGEGGDTSVWGGVDGIEDEVATQIEENPQLVEGVEATVECPDDLQVEEGETFACEAVLDGPGGTETADVEVGVDGEDLVICELMGEGFFIMTASDACGAGLFSSD